MENANIFPGDVLVVDRSIAPKNNQIIVAVVNGEFTVKRLKKQGEKLYLVPENRRFKPTEITDDLDFQVWGVVTYIVHKAK